MDTKNQLSYAFIGLFIFLLLMGPFTQLLQIISLPLHVKWGLSERIILQPEYSWFRSDELAIAWADMTYLVAGIAFVIGAFLRKSWCIPLGFYTSAAWSFIMLLARIRWSLLEANGFNVVEGEQALVFYIYAYVYILFGWYGMYYLWKNRRIYDS